MILSTYAVDDHGNAVDVQTHQSFDTTHTVERELRNQYPKLLTLQMFFPQRRIAVLNLLPNEAIDLARWILATLDPKKGKR